MMLQYLKASKKPMLVFLLFALAALPILAPLSSNDYVPWGDFMSHILNINQAEKALLAGQFPIRVAIDRGGSLFFALFQYYSPLPYTLAALIGLTFHITNAYIVLKLCLWGSLVFAGIYAYRLCLWFSGVETISLLCGIIYIFSPYIIMNTTVRGDFTEVMAQALLPALLYYVLHSFFSQRLSLSSFLITALFWFMLITTHIITFVHGALLLWLFMFFSFLSDEKYRMPLLRSHLPVLFAGLLAAWYLGPVVLTHAFLRVSATFLDPMHYNFITPLAQLFSIASTSPMALPGNSILSHMTDAGSIYSTPVYVSLGLPLILSVSVFVYAYLFNRNRLGLPFEKIMMPMFILFVAALFLTWSPIDIWSVLPWFLVITQFSYRFLIFCMLFGLPISVWALLYLFGNNFTKAHLFVGILLVLIGAQSWMHSLQSVMDADDVHLQNPNAAGLDPNSLLAMYINVYSFRMTYQQLRHLPFRGIESLPFTDENYFLINEIPVELASVVFDENMAGSLRIQGMTADDAVGDLRLKVDGHVLASQHLEAGKALDWSVPVVDLVKDIKSKNVLLSFSAEKTRLLKNARVGFDPALITMAKYRLMSANEVVNGCTKPSSMRECDVNVTDAYNIQLPILYITGLLDIKVDGETVSYLPSLQDKLALATVFLPPGKHHISMAFVGMRWANWLSLISWFVFVLLWLFLCFQRVTVARKNRSG